MMRIAGCWVQFRSGAACVSANYGYSCTFLFRFFPFCSAFFFRGGGCKSFYEKHKKGVFFFGVLTI